MVPGATYHLFNHANGRENLFEEYKNYNFFLDRLSLHVLPVAVVYAYCLMPNHFHLLLKIKDQERLTEHFRQLKERRLQEETGNLSLTVPALNFSEPALIRNISQSFSNCFNSYTQAFNKMYGRGGSLFMPNMKSEEVFDDESFRRVVHYIHNNPVHHRFVREVDKWPHSSYRLFLSRGSTKLERRDVLETFGGLGNFIKYHEQSVDPEAKWFDI